MVEKRKVRTSATAISTNTEIRTTPRTRLLMSSSPRLCASAAVFNRALKESRRTTMTPDKRRERHDAEPADLDEHQDHHLPEPRPIRRGVDDDVPGDAERRDSGEERLDEAGATRT